jgi:hypothetical protein
MTYEYKTLKLATSGFTGGRFDAEGFEVRLNELGREGWELVSCFDTNMAYGQTRDVVAVLKRAR